MIRSYKLFNSLTSILVMILCLYGCTSDPIKIVKNGILKFDSSITIGDAFDNYKFFESVSWEHFTTEQGRNVVQCIGKIKNTYYIIKTQFRISKDDDTKFNISYIGAWEGDEEIIKNLDYIENIYSNSPIDPALDSAIRFENMLKNGKIPF